jgi:metallo-beta-lactamase class B
MQTHKNHIRIFFFTFWMLAMNGPGWCNQTNFPNTYLSWKTKIDTVRKQKHPSVHGEAKPKLVISHLTDQFYVFKTYKELKDGPFPSNSMYVVTKDGVVLIDTPWDSTQFQPLLDSIWARHHKKVVMALATHFHSDRTAGLSYYQAKGIPTYTSRQTHELCVLYNESTSERFFERDTVFHVGGYQFEAYFPGEGHTADNIVVWFDQFKVLYGGCLVKSTKNQDLGNVADANLKAWQPTIKNLIQKYPDARFVIPGHLSWKSNRSLQHTLELLQKNEKSEE